MVSKSITSNSGESGESGAVSVGGTSGASGVASASLDHAPLPTLLRARICQKYSVPSVSPVRVYAVSEPDTVACLDVANDCPDVRH